MIRRILYQPFFIRLLHWEYWPFHIVYAPVYLYWCWLCLRSRSFFFFNTANPGIRNGGFLMESKKEIYDLLPAGSYPATVFIPCGLSGDAVLEAIRGARLPFPLVGKPDIGMQGKSVELLKNEMELLGYAQRSKVDFLLQEWVPFEKELGIFYYRLPGKATGHISGIVEKEFLTVTGDGTSRMEELLRQNKRALLQLKALRRKYGNRLQEILPAGEAWVLVPYGNHARGALFLDKTHLADAVLERQIDAICQQVNGFYYGRLDIRYKNWEDLRQGKNFSIIELNGAGSEPTHIYDPSHSLFFAWREIIRHLNLLHTISRKNYHQQDRPYMRFSSGLRMLRENRRYVKLISGG